MFTIKTDNLHRIQASDGLMRYIKRSCVCHQGQVQDGFNFYVCLELVLRVVRDVFVFYPRYWIQVLCRVPEALGKDQISLGKTFTDCGTR